jgi:hypothetical protein
MDSRDIFFELPKKIERHRACGELSALLCHNRDIDLDQRPFSRLVAT